MKKKLVFILITPIIFLFFIRSVHAYQVLPEYNINIMGTREVKIEIDGFGYGPEITPFIYRQENGKYIYLLSTSWSWKCISDKNILTGDVILPLTSCAMISKPTLLNNINSSGNQVWKDPQILNPSHPEYNTVKDWSWTYDGVFGFAVIGPSGGKKVVALRHAMHGNDSVSGGSIIYQGRVFPDVRADGDNPCLSGFFNGSYQTCWEAQAVFHNIGTAPYNETGGWESSGMLFDEGPVLWPPNGYKNNSGGKESGGFWHATLFPDSNYLYTFFVNTHDLQWSQNACISAARSPIGEYGKAGTWKNYYKGSGGFVNNTLPSGFNKSNISQFYAKSGTTASCINRPGPLSDHAHWFHVARLNNTPFYVAAEEVSPLMKSWAMGVRISTDLINWSPLFTLSTKPSVWGEGDFSYPVLLDKTGSSNHLVDADEFYIVGKHATNQAFSYETNLMQLSFECNNPVTPSNLNYEYISSDQIMITWDSHADNTFYSIRLDDKSNSWSCDALNPGDECKDVTENSYTFSPKQGNSYRFWVHGRNMCGLWGNSAAIDITSIPTLMGDINNDGIVDIQDYVLLSNAFGTNDQSADLNNDGIVDIQDYIILSNNFGKTS